MVISENQRSSGVEVLDQKGTHTDVLYHSFPERYADSYVNALQHFIDVLEGTFSILILYFIMKQYRGGYRISEGLGVQVAVKLSG